MLRVKVIDVSVICVINFFFMQQDFFEKFGYVKMSFT